MSAMQQMLLGGETASGSIALPAPPSILCHFDGSDGATTMIDSSPSTRTISVFGDAQIDTAQSVFGGASLLLDGSGDYLTAPNSSDFQFGSGDFTVRARVRLNALYGSRVIAGLWHGTSNQLSWLFGVDGTTRAVWFYYSTDGMSGTFTPTTSISLPSVGLWADVEASRVSGTLRIFIDGNVGYSASHGGSFYNSAAPLSIGASESGGSYVNFAEGHIDELLVIKGVGLHSAAFTPPSAPYTYP